MNFATESKHLIIDGVVNLVYRNSGMSRVAAVPGLAVKQAEDKKFKADADSPKPVVASNESSHTFVPFAVEDGERMGRAHAHVTLHMLIGYDVSKERLPPIARHMATPLPHVAVTL